MRRFDHHLTQEAAEPGRNQANHRNGYSKKTVLTDATKIEIAVPRDRAGTSDLQLTAKYQRRFPGFDEKIVSMYARGISVREIQGHLQEIYGICQSALNFDPRSARNSDPCVRRDLAE